MSDTQAGLDLEAIRARYRALNSGPIAMDDEISLMFEDVPALIAEIQRLRGEARAQQDDGWTGKACACCGARLDVWTPVPANAEHAGCPR